MTRLRICSDGPILLADGRRAVLEVGFTMPVEPPLGGPRPNMDWFETIWQPVPIVDEPKEDAP